MTADLIYSLPDSIAVDPEGCAAWEARCLAERAADERLAAAYNYSPLLLEAQITNRLTGGWGLDRVPALRRALAIADRRAR
jgi:hypothetical protein